MRQALLRIGLDAELESLDFATYVTRVYTDRAFDITLENLDQHLRSHHWRAAGVLVA